MPEKSLTIWSNMHLPQPAMDRLKSALAAHRLLLSPSLQASNLVSGAPDPQLSQAQVIFGQPDPATLLGLPDVQWVHLTSAGYERYDRSDIRLAFAARSAILTNSSSVYSEPCAEHALAMMLALARRLPDALDQQRGAHGWPAHEIRARSFLLAGQSVLILGFGAIARQLIELLAPFRMEISAIRREPSGNEGVATYPVSKLEALLPHADHVINILPGGMPTLNFMSAGRLARLKPSAIFYNIGRGSTVDQDALAKALKSGMLAAAYLDVTTPEPLPADHALWTLPNCYITPHAAGGADNEHIRLVDHFLANLERFVSGRPLTDRLM